MRHKTLSFALPHNLPLGQFLSSHSILLIAKASPLRNIKQSILVFLLNFLLIYTFFINFLILALDKWIFMYYNKAKMNDKQTVQKKHSKKGRYGPMKT